MRERFRIERTNCAFIGSLLGMFDSSTTLAPGGSGPAAGAGVAPARRARRSRARVVRCTSDADIIHVIAPGTERVDRARTRTWRARVGFHATGRIGPGPDADVSSAGRLPDVARGENARTRAHAPGLSS